MTNADENDETNIGSIGRLARDLDQNAVRAFIRAEMWQFLLDMGWTAGAEPPPLRQQETVAQTAPGDSAATARFKAESELLRGKVAPPQPGVAESPAPGDGRSRAERLRAQLGFDAEAPAAPSSREGADMSRCRWRERWR